MKSFTLFFLLIGLLSGLATPALFAEFTDPDETVKGERTKNGFKIKENEVYVAIPDDRNMKKVAGNVIKAESDEVYLKRRLDQIEQEWHAFRQEMEERVEKIEKRNT